VEGGEGINGCCSMKYAAVIFDLFGTLVEDIIGPPYVDLVVRIASVLSMPADDFNQMWSDTVYARHTGGFHSTEANIAYVCQELGVHPEDNDIKLAAQIRRDYDRRVMNTPRSGAVEVLSRLKNWRHKIGLISNCTPDAPLIWPGTPFASLFDVAVFSCHIGMMKPDHQIYELAAERLGVESKDCLYVGNGSRGELCGAYEVGMYPVLITPGMDEEFLCVSPDERDALLAHQNGTVISSLEEVLALVE
jgi:putative hydrolase of the HAD superfamily